MSMRKIGVVLAALGLTLGGVVAAQGQSMGGGGPMGSHMMGRGCGMMGPGYGMMGYGMMGMGMGPMMMSDANVKVKNLENGVSIDLTSTDPKVVARIQKRAEIMRLMRELRQEELAD